MAMQVHIDELVSHLRAVDGTNLSPTAMREIIAACVRAVREMQLHERRTNEEKSVDGAWGLQEGRED